MDPCPQSQAGVGQKWSAWPMYLTAGKRARGFNKGRGSPGPWLLSGSKGCVREEGTKVHVNPLEITIQASNTFSSFVTCQLRTAIIISRSCRVICCRCPGGMRHFQPNGIQKGCRSFVNGLLTRLSFHGSINRCLSPFPPAGGGCQRAEPFPTSAARASEPSCNKCRHSLFLRSGVRRREPQDQPGPLSVL